MQARGLHGTFYVISDQIRDVSGSSHFMSFAELAVLQDAGNEIGSHGKTHISFIGRSESWLRTECSVSKQALESHGLMVNNFAYPYGETDDFVSSIVLQYYSSARTAYNYPYEISAPYPSVLPAGAGIGDDVDALSRLKIMIDNLAATDKWGIIFFHDVIPRVGSQSDAIRERDFADFLDYVVSKGIQVRTVNEVLTGTSPTPEPTAIPEPIATPQSTEAPESTAKPESTATPAPKPSVFPTGGLHTIVIVGIIFAIAVIAIMLILKKVK